MLTTIFESPTWYKQIVFEVRDWWIVYDVEEDKVKQVQECSIERVQEIINFIILTSPRWVI